LRIALSHEFDYGLLAAAQLIELLGRDLVGTVRRNAARPDLDASLARGLWRRNVISAILPTGPLNERP
jgi:hypothetical protein